MPYLSLPEARIFYVLNPSVLPISGQWPSPLPSKPYDPSLPTLVLLHAPALSSVWFEKQFADPRLRERYNLLGIDMRCSGMTEERDTSKRVELSWCADSVIAVLDALQIGRMAIFGEGILGASAAVWCAYKRPDKVKCIIMASPAWRDEHPDVAASFASLPDLFSANKEGKGDGTGALPEEAVMVLIEYLIGLQGRLEDRRELFRKLVQWRYGPDRSSFEMAQCLTWGYDREPIPEKVLESIKCPVLIFRGGDDEIICPPEATDEWKRLFKNSKAGVVVHEIAGAPHVLSYSDYNVVNRMVSAFVGRHIMS